MDDLNDIGNKSSDVGAVIGLDPQGGSPGRGARRRWIAIATIVAIAAVSGYAYSLRLGDGDATKYLTEPVATRDLTVIVTATGTVQPTNEVDISSELSGTVRTVLVDYNSIVKAGDILAELDTDKLKASVDSAKAKLAAAEAQVRYAEATRKELKIEFDRKQALVSRSVVSQQELNSAEAAYERAVASVESAKADVQAAAAEVKLNETNLTKSCICSPIDGVVLKRAVEPGQTVASSLQTPVLFTIAEDLSKMEVQVDVDEADVGTVREGQTATFTVDAYADRTFDAQIKALRYGSEVVQGVVTYKAVLVTNNDELLLRPGMTATAEITVNEIRQAVVVPNAALRFAPAVPAQTDNRSFLQKLLPGRPPIHATSSNAETTGNERSVYTLVGGAMQQVPVTVGASDGRFTQIVSGKLEPGQLVITDTAPDS
ncbi:MAG: efflux RND transporter periplasmic adaptor subunit [Rhodobiaceae bacterium]|nr:efflux RND transporter periplasmic adaptor subunit [Rhodobiaceae bacterium]